MNNDKKIIMVTGCLGFIGGHLTHKLLSEGHYVYGVDSCTYAANQDLITSFYAEFDNFKFIRFDINELDRLYDCDIIINTAAETHVDNSIECSDAFVRSNIDGVHHLLKLMANNRGKKPLFIHFSTDEVYGDTVEGSFGESAVLNPSNPYSATKAAGDMMIKAWGRTHNIPFIILRPTNNYGIRQNAEKLIPKSIKHLMLGRKIPLHAKGQPSRTWLHVSDTVNAVMVVLNKSMKKDITNTIYNIAGSCEFKNIVVVYKVIDAFFKNDLNLFVIHDDYLDFNYERQGQDVRYSIDGDKLKKLGWKEHKSFDEGIREMVEYHKTNFTW
jgi:dTDP-glucose 4,6-dehydratase